MTLGLPSPKRLVLCLIAIGALALSACSTLDRRSAVPPELRRSTSVLGIPNARFFRDQPENIMAEQKRQLIREAKYLGVPRGGQFPEAYILSLSGGGDDGAFGAGLLVGWTAHGDRPKFKLVTGVSTGALIAPFAFLGSEYDDALTDVYTNVHQSDIFIKRFPTAALTDDAMADTAPLFATISKYVDAHMMARIAEEYKKGLNGVINSDEKMTDIYISQIYQVAQINKTKYTCVRRAVWFVVIALASQLSIIAYIFAQKT